MRQWAAAHEKQLKIVIWALLGLGFAVTRLWQLDRLPYGMHMDEAGMAYDAVSLANYGVDRWLKSWPVYLNNFGVGQSSLYAFLCAGLFKLFGYSIWLVRLPAVCFSLLTLVFGAKLAGRIWNNHPVPSMLTGALVVFCPYFVMAGRFGLDCNLMLGASTVFLYFFLSALQTEKTWRYLTAGIAGGILLYTYILSYLILPLFLLLSFAYVLAVHRFSLKKWICMGIPMGILAFPLIWVQIINLCGLEEAHLGIFTITRLMGYRVAEIGWFRWEYLISALRHTFVGDSYLFDSIPGIWNLYGVTAVLAAIGFFHAVAEIFRRKDGRAFSPIVLPLMWFAAMLFVESHIDNSTYTINGIFLVTALLAVEGSCVLCRGLQSRKRTAGFASVVMLALCGIYAICFLRFGVFYYSGRYTRNTYPLEYFGIPFPEGAAFLEGDDVLRDKLTYVSEVGIFYAVGTQISPYEFGLGGDECAVWKNYWFGSLQEISDECNYLVRDGYEFEEYCGELRQAGFCEQRFEGYSVFYKK